MFPFLTFDQYPSLDPFVSDSEVACSDRLIDVSSYHSLHSVFGRWASLDFDHILVRTLLIRSEAEQTHVLASGTNFPGHRLFALPHSFFF